MNRSASTQRRQQQSILLPSTIIKNKWKVTNKIGQGSFGETYAATDMHTSEGVAVKVEKLDDKKMVLKQEVIVLKQLQACPYVVRYIHSGRQEHFNFLIMERLGENLAELRKQRSNGTFSMCTALRLGLQMMEALEGIHKLGFIHRDVKPSNFVMGYKTNAKKRGRAYLIDFGLARKYRLPSGEVRPPRKNAGFRGTARYASINSHYKRELGRVDDLWSVFYAVIEFLKGSLPWMKMKDKEQIGQVKEKETNPELCRDLPAEFLYFMEHLQKLGYADEPDYFYLKNLLQTIYDREGLTDDMPFDWNTQQLSAASPLPQLAQNSMIEDPPVMSTYARGSASITNVDGNLSSSVKVSNQSTNSGHLGREYSGNPDVRPEQRPTRHSLPNQQTRDAPQDDKNPGKRRKKVHCKPCSIM